MSASKNKAKTIQPVVYAGRRLQGNKVFQVFLDTKTKKLRYFTGIRRVYIGNTYEATAAGMMTHPKRVEAEKIINAEWEAQDALVDEFNAERRADAKLAALDRPLIKTAIVALTPLVEQLDSFGLRKLITVLTHEAFDQRRKKTWTKNSKTDNKSK